MLRLASNALGDVSVLATTGPEQELRRHYRGAQALIHHLTVGGTDAGILIGLIGNALTGYSLATAEEAQELDARAERRAD